MSLLDNRVCEDDINRVNAIRHHPKYETGFEEESREEKVWYERDSTTGLPCGYYLFPEIEQEFKRAVRSGAVGENIGGNRVVGSVNMSENMGGAVESRGGTIKKKRKTLFDILESKLLKYVGLQ